MGTREKIILVAAAYLIAVALFFFVAAPAFTDAQTRLEELDKKRKESTELKIKLGDVLRLRKEHTDLQTEIDQLRGSVPKSPDIDILMLDLEKMALASGLDLVAVEEPEKDKLKATEAAEQEGQPQPAPKVAKAVSGAGAAAGATGQALSSKESESKPAPPPHPTAVKKEVSPAVETGLVKHYLLVQAQGGYAGLIDLMKKLEAYQRVIAVNQIEIGFQSEGKEQKDLDSNKLKISFFLTAYYLP